VNETEKVCSPHHWHKGDGRYCFGLGAVVRSHFKLICPIKVERVSATPLSVGVPGYRIKSKSKGDLGKREVSYQRNDASSAPQRSVRQCAFHVLKPGHEARVKPARPAPGPARLRHLRLGCRGLTALGRALHVTGWRAEGDRQGREREWEREQEENGELRAENEGGGIGILAYSRMRRWMQRKRRKGK
jgi:hypothetical protein